MKFSTSSFALLFLLPLFSLAQRNYKPGYVVTAKGDTLNGFIDYQGWGSNPSSINFVSEINAKSQKFDTSNMNFFSIDGHEAYKKVTCSISMDVVDDMRLNHDRDTSFKIATVFFKILQTGKNLVLYSFTDDIKTRYYIGEAPNYIPTELVYKVYQDPDAVTDTNGSTVYDNTFLKQLSALAAKYNVFDDDLSEAYGKALYRKSDLMLIVSKINRVSKADFNKRYAENNKLKFYVAAGVNIATTSSTPVASYTVGGGKAATSYQPVVGFGISVLPNPNTDRFEFRAELLLSTEKFRSVYQHTVTPVATFESSFDKYGVTIVPQFIYNFYNTPDFKFYGGVGFSVSYFKYTNSSLVSRDPNNSAEYVAYNAPYYFENIDDGLLLTAGVRFNKKFEVFVNYTTSVPTTNAGYYQFSTVTKQVGLIYLFGK